MTATTGPEDLLLGDDGVGRHVGEDVGADVVAVAGPAAGRGLGEQRRPALAACPCSM